MTLANKYRPVRFEDIVGQETEIKVISAILTKAWYPPALLFSGAFGCGKTTMARLAARALLCTDVRQGPKAPEPCGKCNSCKAMDAKNHPDYVEVDAASHGEVKHIKQILADLAYRSGSRRRVVVFDECHMITENGQNCLLNTLEEGLRGVMFMFCTTDPGKMLPTIRSRCLQMPVRLHTTKAILARVLQVAKLEGIEIEESAARLVATYSRGHLRDAMIFLEQLGRMENPVTAEATRTCLRLDDRDEVYRLLTLTEQKERLEALETLLCRVSFADLGQEVGEVLLGAYKLSRGITDIPDADQAWLQRVLDTIGAEACLPAAERCFFLPKEAPTIMAAVAALANAIGTLDLTPAGGVRSGHGGRTHERITRRRD